MEKTKNIFAEIYDFENLMAGYNHTLQTLGDTWHESGIRIDKSNADEVVIDIQNHIIHKSYEVGNPFL